MPREGYKSVAIKEEDYDFFKNMWETNKSEYRKKGITTFAGFVTMMLYGGLYTQKLADEYKAFKELTGKIQDES